MLDHGLVSGVEKDTESRGAPRVLDKEEALAVAVSALLMKAGLKRNFVQGFVRGLFLRKAGCSSPGAHWLRRGTSADDEKIEALEIADRASVRIARSGASRVSRWQDLRTRTTLTEEYVPLVIVRIDLVELRRRLHEE